MEGSFGLCRRAFQMGKDLCIMVSANYFMMLLVSIPAIFIATTAHEFTRAAVSSALGDNYPKSQGRLTLNPFKHFEPIGFLLLLYSGGFGWGRPVDTSVLYYKNRKRDTLLTAILPSVVNLALGVIFLWLYLWVYAEMGLGAYSFAAIFLNTLYRYNFGLAVYNLLPVAPMDCVKVLSVLMPANTYFRYMQNEKLIQVAFLMLMFFGLITGIMNTIIHSVIGLFSGLFFIF